MVSLKDLYYGVAKAVKGICDFTCYKNRPKSTDMSLGSYLVITFPAMIYNQEMDGAGSYKDYTTSLLLYVYVRQNTSARNTNAPDIKSLDDKVSKVMSVFPIDDANIHVSHPQIIIQNDDGSGFDVVAIRADLRTK